MVMKISFLLSLLLAVVLGMIIARIDTSPGWDDAGISVFMIFAAASLCGFLAKEKPWMIALLVGAWIPLFNILTSHNFGSIIALVPGFLGAFAGYFIRRILVNKK